MVRVSHMILYPDSVEGMLTYIRHHYPALTEEFYRPHEDRQDLPGKLEKALLALNAAITFMRSKVDEARSSDALLPQIARSKLSFAEKQDALRQSMELQKEVESDYAGVLNSWVAPLAELLEQANAHEVHLCGLREDKHMRYDGSERQVSWRTSRELLHVAMHENGLPVPGITPNKALE